MNKEDSPFGHINKEKAEVKYLHHHISTPVATGPQEHVFQSYIDQLSFKIDDLMEFVYTAEESFRFGELTLDEIKDFRTFCWSIRGATNSIEESKTHLEKSYGRENILNFAKYKRVTLVGGNDE